MNDDWQSLTPPKGGVPAMIVINWRDGLASGVPDTVEVLRQWNGVKTEPARGWLHTEPLVVEERHGEGASEILLVKFEADQPGLGTHFWPWTEQGVETSKWIWRFFATHGASD
jgi:poly(3-hydroxybutyrate) depolymerase